MDASDYTPSRLVDYFVVVGFDDASERNGVSRGEIIQRFPTQDWPDVKFYPSLEVFCQPGGWTIRTEQTPPQFFITVLTDLSAGRAYAAVLAFSEPRFPSEYPMHLQDDMDYEDTNDDPKLPVSVDFDPQPINNSPVLYNSKCLVLVSKHPYFEAFRMCLGTIYTIHIEKLPFELESVIGTLLGGVVIPPPGGGICKFSLGASDRLAVQPPLSATVPATQSAVAIIFQQLGMYNVVCLFCAVMTERKIIFQSQSYTRMTEASMALSSLMYPLQYRHVYVPLLPTALHDFLHSPMPYIMGMHSSFKVFIADLPDVIIADLDAGCLEFSVPIPPLPEPYHSRLLQSLTLVLNKNLFNADLAFPPTAIRTPTDSVCPSVDKQIRACFVRLMGELLSEYRVCLQLVRIHPTPVIEFHRSAFLGLRGMQDDLFMNALIQSNNAFEAFIHERGPPFRLCDLFDEVYSSIGRTLKEENGQLSATLDNIHVLAQQLLMNECSASQPFTPKYPQPTDAVMSNATPAAFPKLDPSKVASAIELSGSKVCEQRNGVNAPAPREVPNAPSSSLSHNSLSILGPNVRRLDVLRSCLRCIFEDKISDARKMLSAVVLSMKSQSVRVAFCQELHIHSKERRSLLEAQQFDLIVRLMNHALQNESENDEHGVAYAMLQLSNTFHRRLSHAVLQFAYTCIQEHAVWLNPKFWEAAYFHDVQTHLKGSLTGSSESKKLAPYGRGVLKDTWNLYEEPSAMRIACDKIRDSKRMSDCDIGEAKREEDEIIKAELGHYAYYMVNMRVPLDATKLRHVNVQNLERSAAASSITPSSVDDEYASDTSSSRSEPESGFAEDNSNSGVGMGGRDLGMGIVYWIDKIMDKLSEKAALPEAKTREVKQKVPGLVAMQIEQLEHVYRESKRLPPINKPKVLVPSFLPGENMLQGYLRVYLLADGRYEANKMIERTQGSCLLPAEGALFLTNYRIIFKGQPCDPFICEQVVLKSIPVMSITTTKQLGQQTLLQTGAEQSSHFLRDALQIRSCTFQLLKIAFDEEVNSEKVDTLVNAMEDLRHPTALGDLFALSGAVGSQGGVPQMHKPKGDTLKNLVKNKIKKTKLMAGIGGHSSNLAKKPQRSLAQNNQPSSDSDEDSRTLRIDDCDPPPRQSLSRTLDRLVEREYCKDYQRLSLCLKTELTLHSGGANPHSPNASIKASPGHHFKLRKNQESAFRLCTVNRLYSVCRSYPAVFIVPSKVTDESIWKVAKGHKHARFPVVTWMSDGGALLIRGSGFHVKTMVGRLKKQAGGLKAAGVAATGMGSNVSPPNGSLANLSILKSSVEQEKYMEALVSLSPSQAPHSQLRSSVGSLLSLDSLMLTSLDGASLGGYSQNTPETYKRPFAANNTLVHWYRGSGGKGSKPLLPTNRSGSLRPPIGPRPHSGHHSPSSSTISLMSQNQRKRASGSDQTLKQRDPMQGPQTLTRACLYIFGDKAQTKILKLDPRCEFIPVDYPTAHDAKVSLKKFLRVTAPANLNGPDNERSHLKLLEESGWLQQVRSIMYISSAVVDVVDIQNSSVAFCFEDGWDATCQLICISQILLDPYYRTFDGLRALIEKEWLGFGHRFSHRLNHLAESVHSGIAPTFILFLDALHQIVKQYPVAFEYNDYYLRLLAYHSTSTYFKTFLLDCEADRVEAGVVQFDARPRKRPELHSQSEEWQDDGTLKRAGVLGRGGSFWDYADEKRRKTTILSNTLYLPNSHNVLRPSFALPNLDIWEYYTEDHMSHGASYDFECVECELVERVSNHSSIKEVGLVQSTRKVVDLNYNNALFLQQSNLQHLLEEIGGLERDLDQLPRHWTNVLQTCRKHALERVEGGGEGKPTPWYRWLGRALHKKTTVELLLRGVRTSQTRLSLKMSMGDGVPHNFHKCTFSAPEPCTVCQRMLWGVVLAGSGVRCSVCRSACHDKCAVVAANSCIASRGSRTLSTTESNDAATLQREDTFEEGLAEYRPISETRTHEGYLMKKGVLLKTWKQRWFVLDSIKHQLRYYDTMEDGHCKGFIDLSEVSEVQSAPVPVGVPRKTEGAFFDLRTLRRVYNFSAASETLAKEWIDKIESCLRES